MFYMALFGVGRLVGKERESNLIDDSISSHFSNPQWYLSWFETSSPTNRKQNAATAKFKKFSFALLFCHLLLTYCIRLLIAHFYI